MSSNGKQSPAAAKKAEANKTDALMKIAPSLPALQAYLEERLKPFVTIADEATTVSTKLAIKSLEDEGKTADVLAKIKQAGQNAEAVRKEIGDPFRTVTEIVNGRFKAITETFAAAEKRIKGKILEFRAEIERQQREQERKEREAREAAAREAEAKRIEALVAGRPAPAAPPPPPPPEQKPAMPTTTVGAGGGSIGIRKVWTFEIIDENLIPREYLMVNEKLIRAAVGAGKRSIPGVRIFEQSSVASGR